MIHIILLFILDSKIVILNGTSRRFDAQRNLISYIIKESEKIIKNSKCNYYFFMIDRKGNLIFNKVYVMITTEFNL